NIQPTPIPITATSNESTETPSIVVKRITNATAPTPATTTRKATKCSADKLKGRPASVNRLSMSVKLNLDNLCPIERVTLANNGSTIRVKKSSPLSPYTVFI